MPTIAKRTFFLLLLMSSHTCYPLSDSMKIAFGLSAASAFGFAAGAYGSDLMGKIRSLLDRSPEQNGEEIAGKTGIGFLNIDCARYTAWDYFNPLMDLFFDKNVEAIILQISGNQQAFETPQVLYDMIVFFKKTYPKPVIAFCESLIADGYIVACAADAIFAASTSMVGGIANAIQVPRMTAKNQHEGIQIDLITKGRFKGLTHEDLPEKEEHIKVLQELANNVQLGLIEGVERMRPCLSKSRLEWEQGQVYSAHKAVELKLIDGVCNKMELFQHIFDTLKRPCDLEKLTIFTSAARPTESFAYDNAHLKVGLLRMTDLTWNSSWDYLHELQSFFARPDLRGIILAIDSCGSTSKIGISLHHDIMALKAFYNKPVVAYVEKNALSGGYSVASAADWIIASPFSLTGSVGALIELRDISQKNAKEHLEFTLIKGSKYADLWCTNNPNPERKKIFDELLDFDYKNFVDMIKKARPALSKADESLWAEAQVFLASDAQRIGIIDQVGSPIDAFTFLKHKIFGTQETLDIRELDVDVIHLEPSKQKKDQEV